MNFQIMADAARYLKENPKGVGQVCKIMEEMREEFWRAGKLEGEIEGANGEKQNIVLGCWPAAHCLWKALPSFLGFLWVK